MTKAGHIYFIQESTQTGPVKVGFSTNTLNRLETLQGWSPRPLNILHTFMGVIKEELMVHQYLAPHWLYGEWFAPHADVFAAMWALKFDVLKPHDLPRRGQVGRRHESVMRFTYLARECRDIMTREGCVPSDIEVRNYLETSIQLRHCLYSDALYQKISNFKNHPKEFGVSGHFRYDASAGRYCQQFFITPAEATP